MFVQFNKLEFCINAKRVKAYNPNVWWDPKYTVSLKHYIIIWLGMRAYDSLVGVIRILH